MNILLGLLLVAAFTWWILQQAPDIPDRKEDPEGGARTSEPGSGK